MQQMPSFEGVVLGVSKLMRRYNDMLFLGGWCKETVKDTRVGDFFSFKLHSLSGHFFLELVGKAQHWCVILIDVSCISLSKMYILPTFL